MSRRKNALINDLAADSAFVHPLALTDVVHIGANSRIWQFASVIRGAKVGEDCTIASGALVDCATIGDRCIISHGAAIEPGVVLGNDVFVGPGVVFCNDAWPRVSKDGFDMVALLSGEVTITLVEDGASIGAHATVLPGVTIGAGAMIAAGAVVDDDVPPRHLFKRNGQCVPIDTARKVRRMRVARGVLPVAAE